MNKKNLMPQPSQPVNRIIAGQLPDVLAELSEDALELRGEAFEALVSTSRTLSSYDVFLAVRGHVK